MTINFGSLVTRQRRNRAVVEAARIADKPTTVTFKTPDGSNLDPQQVRIEYDDTASDTTTESGVAGVRQLTIFGILDHPVLVDTDIAAGYRFNLENRQYTVTDVIRTIGQIQARAEAVG